MNLYTGGISQFILMNHIIIGGNMNIKAALSELNIRHDNLQFVPSTRTYLDGNTLYYKHIPSALLFLNHLSLFKTELKDDGLDVKGTMIDLSRNAVFKLNYFKSVIRKQALLGFNEIWLYLEDVYNLDNYPKFGYLRGKYNLSELKSLDHYADSLGVTLVPCIQTLGHMGQFLRWSSSDEYKDQSDVLMIDTSHKLISDMVKFCKAAFKTQRIHVGMDETFGFGLGQYYKKYGYNEPETLFMAHLNQVNNICLESGFKDVFIWSDMFFRHRSLTSSYYDHTIVFDKAFIDQIPMNVGLVYWDYYNEDLSIYLKMLEKHLQMNRKVIMASGTWIWTKLMYDQSKTLATTTHAIEACKRLNLKEIIFTQWQDDGAYVDYETNYLGLYDVTNIMTDNDLNTKYLGHVTEFDYETLCLMSQINHLGYYPIQLLWDDLLLGIYLNNLIGYDYKKLTLPIRKTNFYLRSIEKNSHLYYIVDILKLKLSIRQSLLKDYFTDGTFDSAIRKAKLFKKRMLKLVESFEKMWHERYRPFGLEVLQNRLFSQIRRADEVLYWINAYTSKEIDHIPFMEEILSKEPYLTVKHLDIAFSSKQ